MKGQILNLLKSHKGIVSGERLSSELGVSRVSVWKHIRKLKELGYPIRATAKGYRLVGDSDALHPWEFPNREPHIHYFPEAASTMDIARDLARKGCPHFTVVIAGLQTNGRGRLRRAWLSQKGGLYFTMILRPQIPSMLSPRLNFSAAVDLVHTLRSRFGIHAHVKWPNDILVSGKKICGILSEMEAEGDLTTIVNIGIGMNVNNDPLLQEPKASSIKKILKKTVSRKKILSEFLDRFETRIQSTGLDSIVDEWKQYTTTLNRGVKIVTLDEVSEGIALDVDENGALIIKDAGGRIKKILCGDCFET